MQLTIELSEDEQKRLESVALAMKTTPEGLVQHVIEQMLLEFSRDDDTELAFKRILKKNRELYQRLASGR